MISLRNLQINDTPPHPGGNMTTVLRDISLGFFYGAKIGVLGLNGAGISLPQGFTVTA